MTYHTGNPKVYIAKATVEGPGESKPYWMYGNINALEPQPSKPKKKTTHDKHAWLSDLM